MLYLKKNYILDYDPLRAHKNVNRLSDAPEICNVCHLVSAGRKENSGKKSQTFIG